MKDRKQLKRLKKIARSETTERPEMIGRLETVERLKKIERSEKIGKLKKIVRLEMVRRSETERMRIYWKADPPESKEGERKRIASRWYRTRHPDRVLPREAVVP